MAGIEGGMYLQPTAIIDSDHPRIKEFAREATVDATGAVAKAVRLYLEVRDGIRYDPYSPFHLPIHYQASKVLERGRSFCVPKVSLLCALARACAIPARLGFADVKNHLASKKLIEMLGSNIFVYHGFAELYLEGKWVKATPAFNRELCEKYRVPPLEVNGKEDSLFHAFDSAQRQHMEYLQYHDTHPDVPVAKLLSAWEEAYGVERVRGWKRQFPRDGGADFSDEEPLA
jgi:transglutaminase-like putative cysteine protease